jgi:magnesium transporter
MLMIMNALVRLVLPDVQDLLREGTPDDIRKALQPFHAADIAELVEKLDDPEAGRLVEALDLQHQVYVLEQLDAPQCARLVRLLGPEKVAPAVARMASDDRADLVAELEPELGQKLLALLPAEERQEVTQLVTYPEGTAGAIMSADHVALSLDETAKEAIEHVRQVARRRETIYALYVVDPDGRLQGAVSLETLILSPAEKKMRDIMIPPISVPVDADQEAVVKTLRHYDFLAVPVVDPNGKMLGIVTHDDALDVAIEEADEDAQLMGAVKPLGASYFETGFVSIVRARALWLTVLFFVELIGGSILRNSEEVLKGSALALMFFLPLITASGGNSGSQSATLVIRGLAVGDIKTSDWWRILRRELACGLVLGGLLGVYAIVVASVWGIGTEWTKIAATVLATLVCVVTGGSLLGSLMPLAMARVGVDPAITSSPLVTCTVDVLGIVILMSVAWAILI